MSDTAHARLMARYNRWQNHNLVTTASRLTQADRRLDRGAFFGSIEATFAHLLWADRVWLSRFEPVVFEPPDVRPERGATVDWRSFVGDRQFIDGSIVLWADALTERELNKPLTWSSGLSKSKVTRDRSVLITHFFNHQTHHRGQIHAMLTAAGATPGDTDLMGMPDLDPA